MAIRILVRLAVVLVCVAGVTVSVIARDSRVRAEEVFVYYNETLDKRGAIERIHDAKRLNPNYQFDIAEAQLDTRRAVQILTPAVKEEPENAELWVSLSRSQAAAGDRAAARRSYARARELAPLFLPPDGAPGG